MNMFLIITWILVVARWVIAIQLTRVSFRQKLPNLLWLAAFFYITGAGDIFFTLSPFTSLLWPFNLSVGLGEVVLVMFIQKTFYQDRKSPFWIFMTIALAFLVVNLFFAPFLAYWSPFNWLWLIWVGYAAYKPIATDPTVEDWVKARYKLIIAYSLVALILSLYTILSIVGIFVPAVIVLLTSPVGGYGALIINVVSATIGVVLEYLAWVMPEGYRHWLNRNYQTPIQDKLEAELSEEEIMRKMKARS